MAVSAMTRSNSAPDLLPTVQTFNETLVNGANERNGVNGCGYQVFSVCEERCQVLTVTIARGRGITRGKLKDWLYSPDPYVTAQVLGTPNGPKKTRHVTNSCDPLWNEKLQFFIDPHRDRLIEFVLYDLNRTVNEEIGREMFDFYGFQHGVAHNIIISYKNGSKIEVKLYVEKNHSTNLRFGLDLCQEEKAFRDSRKAKVYQGLQAILDKDKVPQSLSESPTVCLMTSGGGFRAMIAYCGAYKAMEDAGIIDCVTYLTALSGSSWYLSTLFSHPDFAKVPNVSHKIKPEIRTCVERHWQVHLSPPWSSRYLRKIIAKSVNGQPVSFTDFYGYLVGQQLLKGRMKARLSDQAEKIAYGCAPMPMYTCLHVKSNVSAKIFQEWYEFTPYEVGIPKYGTFLKTQDFASKFYMGQKVKSFPEVRLHFLYGIWGSAFTILFKRLVQEKGRNGQNEILKMILDNAADCKSSNDGTSNSIADEDEELIVRCFAQESGSDDESSKEGSEKQKGLDLDGEEIIFCEPMTSDSEEIGDTETESDNKMRYDYEDIMSPTEETIMPMIEVELTPIGRSEEQGNNSKSEDDQDTIDENKAREKKTLRQRWRQYNLLRTNGKKAANLSALEMPSSSPINDALKVPNDDKNDKASPTASERILEALESERSRWDRVLERALTTTPLDSRAFRAGVILNPLRGLTVQANGCEGEVLSPVKATDRDDCDFKGYRESMKTDEKKIYMVDSGLSFNLPFPLTVRPQRGIELYITMDFSSRKSDSTPPFRELLLAEKWALLHRIPFPPIREIVKQFLDDPVQECYVFKDANDANTPVIIFFPLVNKDFRKYKSPGVLRQTEEEKLFGDFKIFDDTNAYAIWRFVYPNLSFDRLTAMMEFNVLNNLDIIKAEMAEIIQRKRQHLT